MLVSLALPMSLMFSTPTSAFTPTSFVLHNPINNATGVSLTPYFNITVNAQATYDYSWTIIYYWGVPKTGGGWTYLYTHTPYWYGSNGVNITVYTNYTLKQLNFNGGNPLNYGTSYSWKISFCYDDEFPQYFGNHTYYFTTTVNQTVPPPTPSNLKVYTTLGNVGWSSYDAPLYYGVYKDLQPIQNIQYVEGACFVPIDGQINQVQLGIYTRVTPISGNPVYGQSNINDFYAWINKIPMGSPTYINWTDYVVNALANYVDYYGIMTWKCNVTVNNQNQAQPKVVLELKSTNKNLYVRYGLNNTDIFSDSVYSFLVTDIPGLTPNGYVDAQGIWGYKAKSYGPQTFPPDKTYKHDLGWAFTYYHNETSKDINNINGNWIDVEGTKIQYQPLYISYSVNDLSLDKYLRIYFAGNGSEIHYADQGLTTKGYPINLYQGTYIWVPEKADNYIFKIQNDTNYSFVFTGTIPISAYPDLTWIVSLPAFGNTVSPIILEWQFYPSTPGIIGVFTHSADTNDLTKAVDTITGIKGGFDSMTYTPPINTYPENRVYYRFFSNNSQPLGSVMPFELYTATSSTLSAIYPKLTIGKDGGTETFQYGHNYVGAKVAIFIGDSNGKLTMAKDVSWPKSGTIDIPIANVGGNKTAALEVYLSGAWRTIYTTTFVVAYVPGYVPVIPTKGVTWDVVGWIGPLWAAVFGLSLVILCMAIPLIIDLKFKSQLSKSIPPLAWSLFGGVGIAISVVLGLWPGWIIFFLVAIMIIVAIFIYVFKTSLARSEN